MSTKIKYTTSDISRLVAVGFARWLDESDLMRSDLAIDELFNVYIFNQLNAYQLPVGISPSDIVAAAVSPELRLANGPNS